jgi:transcriptional regulator with PAS, ATPase and Fis domain
VSNVPLEAAVREGRFRADLFYRLNVIEFRVPPLRERPGAVIPIAHQLLRTSTTAACQGVTAIAPSASGAMVAYQWPGNVRELRNVIEGASAMAQGPVIQLADLPAAIRNQKVAPCAIRAAAALPAAHEYTFPPTAPTGGDDETNRILEVLRKHNNNRRGAAAELGISHVSLYKKLHKSGAFVRKQRPANPAE